MHFLLLVFMWYKAFWKFMWDFVEDFEGNSDVVMDSWLH
jgi:hypothetical protein